MCDLSFDRGVESLSMAKSVRSENDFVTRAMLTMAAQSLG